MLMAGIPRVFSLRIRHYATEEFFRHYGVIYIQQIIPSHLALRQLKALVVCELLSCPGSSP